MNRSKRWVPSLAHDHPGFFKVALSLVLIHFVLSIDALQSGPRHSPVFQVINNFLGDQLIVLTVFHVVIALLIVAGLYWKEHFILLRYGCGLSFVMFNVLAVGFGLASYLYDLSYYSAIASVTLSLSSLAAIKEPPIQAATNR